MAVKTRAIEYIHNDETFEGVLAYDDAVSGERPGVLVSHAWSGRTDDEVGFARSLAELGYAGFALDLYGKGKRGSSKEENQRLMAPLVEDRSRLQARLLHILDIVKDQPEVNSAKLAAMGFCFGGLCVLDLARAGGDVRGVASFHGLLKAPDNLQDNSTNAKVIVYHGWDDPMVPPEDVVAFGKEMTAAKADWRLLAHGGAMHAFMAKNANDPDFGTVYNEKAATRSWESFQDFLKECFA